MADWELALLIALLLFCVADRKPGWPDQFSGLALIGVLLVFLPPGIFFVFRMETLLVVVIPLAIWVLFQDWILIRWQLEWKQVLSWFVIVILPGLVLAASGVSAWPAALACCAVLAGLLWRGMQAGEKKSLISLLGPMFLIFFLTEAEPEWFVHQADYLASLFSGGFYGLVLAGTTMVVATRIPDRFRSWTPFIQVLLTYWFALAAGLSAVTASLVSLAVYAELKQLGHIHPEFVPAPSRVGFSWLRSILLLFLLVFAWQTHLLLEWSTLWLVGAAGIIVLVLSWVFGRLGFLTMPKLPVPHLARSGMLLAAGVPVSASFLKADAGSISVAALLTGTVSLLGFVLLKSTRYYRSQLLLSSEEAKRWERIYRRTRLIDLSDKDPDE